MLSGSLDKILCNVDFRGKQLNHKRAFDINLYAYLISEPPIHKLPEQILKELLH